MFVTTFVLFKRGLICVTVFVLVAHEVSKMNEKITIKGFIRTANHILNIYQYIVMLIPFALVPPRQSGNSWDYDRMNTLLLHHLESLWEPEMNLCHTSIYSEVNTACEYILHHHVDKIIVTRSSDHNLDLELDPLIQQAKTLNVPLTYYFYGTGERTPDPTTAQHWIRCKRTTLHPLWLPIPSWAYDLKSDHVTLGGMFRFECIADMEVVLSTLGIHYHIEKTLTVY
jgi:hypothetical protein